MRLGLEILGLRQTRVRPRARLRVLMLNKTLSDFHNYTRHEIQAK